MSNDDLPPSAHAPATATTKSGVLVWLSNFNNLITSFGAIVASIAAIYSTLNKSKIERIESQVKQLDLQTRTEQRSRDYANIFIQQVLSDDKIKNSEKRVQALLSILNIEAQASGNQEGTSNARTRAMTPVVLALLLGEPGGVAQMDESYEYVDDWVAIACADNSQKTRVTAIQALCGMCQKALRAGRLDIVVKGVRAVDQLFALIPKPVDPKDPDYNSVLAARSQLATFIKKEDNLLDVAKDPDKTAGLGKPDALRAEVRAAFPEANAIVLETKAKLEAKVARVEQAEPDPAKQTAETKRYLAQLKGSVAQLEAAVTSASEVAVAQISYSPAPTGSPMSSTSPGASPAAHMENAVVVVKELIKNLQDKDAQVRRRSRSQLGLLGQTAVKPLLGEVAARFGKNAENDYRLRLGVAEALNLMSQPISLDPTDAYWVVSLLRSNDHDTRLQVAEFLMNLEKDASVLNCFDELEKLFYELCGSPKDGGNAVINAAVVVGTWARNIAPDTASRVPSMSMPQLALQTAKLWQKILTDSKIPDWGSTITALNDLIQRAEVVQQKNAALTSVTPK